MSVKKQNFTTTRHAQTKGCGKIECLQTAPTFHMQFDDTSEKCFDFSTVYMIKVDDAEYLEFYSVANSFPGSSLLDSIKVL
jgi:hypothetical protein